MAPPVIADELALDFGPSGTAKPALTCDLLHLYTSADHNYFGHHGQGAGAHRIEEQPAIECVAHQGIRGDRFFGYKPDYKGQITFFADEVYQSLCRQFRLHTKPPSVFRRNVITRGIDLELLIGVNFMLGDVRFAGVESCKPCYWMDQAFSPGAEAAMKGKGGLRARILTDGTLRPGPVRFTTC